MLTKQNFMHELKVCMYIWKKTCSHFYYGEIGAQSIRHVTQEQIHVQKYLRLIS